MLRARGCTSKIISVNIVKTRLLNRVFNVKKENTKLFATLAFTIAISLNSETSQNNYSIIAINVSFLGPRFEVYKRYIKFIKIEGSYSSENLARIVEGALNKHNLLLKLISITADNASNNNTFYYHLYNSIARKYDDHLEEFPSRDSTMRFKGKGS